MRSASVRRLRTAAMAAAAGLFAASAAALGPHELLLLVNRECFDSLTVANHYIALRGIPLSNVVYLDLPDAALAPEGELTPEQFARSLWEPARTAVRERNLGDHVLAWIFSAGFPLRVRTDPRMSTHGLVFARNEAPESEAIRLGQYGSPLFRGPVRPDAPAGPPLTLETLNAALGERMPQASMTLAHTGARGLSRADAVALLHRSAAADSVRPEGTVYFVVSEDVRSKAREWQYEGAVAELDALGIRAVQTDQFPNGAEDVLGILVGAAHPAPSRIGAFLPGAMAEHLTSFAAYFDQPNQTKITAWLAAGATSSTGTVTEPLSIWTKFPAARFFVHYAQGCTLLESYLQSIASPVQTLMLGDPLTAPWRPALALELFEEFDDPEGARVFRARLEPEVPADYLFFLDGTRISPLVPEPRVRLDPEMTGHHVLRAVAYQRGTLRHQAFARLDVERPAPERNVRLVVDPQPHPRWRPLRLGAEAQGEPSRLRLLAQGRTVASVDGGGPDEFAVHPAELGAGPVVFQAVAEYPGDTEIRSPPVTVTILDEPPPLPDPAIRIGRDAGGPLLQAEVRGDTAGLWTWDWMAELWPAGTSLPDTVQRIGEGDVEVNAGERVLRIRPKGEESAPTLLLLAEAEGDGFEVMMEADPTARAGEFGLVFFASDEGHHAFFGWDARRSGWVLTTTAGGRTRRVTARGAPGPGDGFRRLAVRVLEDGRIEATVDGLRIGVAPADRIPRAGILAGLRVQGAAARFQRPLRRIDTGAPPPDGIPVFRPEQRPETPLWLRGVLDTAVLHREARP